jgi:hypothetical protein
MPTLLGVRTAGILASGQTLYAHDSQANCVVAMLIDWHTRGGLILLRRVVCLVLQGRKSQEGGVEISSRSQKCFGAEEVLLKRREELPQSEPISVLHKSMRAIAGEDLKLLGVTGSG